MGAVYVKVRLVNVFDQMKADDEELRPEQVRSCEAMALVDTGATRSVIPMMIFERLGLKSFDRMEVVYADGRSEEVIVTSPVQFHILDRDTSDDAVVLGDEVLIGQTVLEKLDLLVDCKNQKVIPNPKHPNGPVFRV